MVDSSRVVLILSGEIKDYFLEKTMFPEHLEFMCKRVKLILFKRVRVYFCCVEL